MRRVRRRVAGRDAPQLARHRRLAGHGPEAQRTHEHAARVVRDEVVEAGHAGGRAEEQRVIVAHVTARDHDAAAGVRHEAADAAPRGQHRGDRAVRRPAVHPAGHDVAEEQPPGGWDGSGRGPSTSTCPSLRTSKLTGPTARARPAPRATPPSGGRVDAVVVARAQDERGPVAAGARGLHVAPARRPGRPSGRPRPGRRAAGRRAAAARRATRPGSAPAPRRAARPAAPARAAAGVAVLARAGLEVGGRRLGDDRGQRHDRVAARRRPQGQRAAGRVADRDDPGQVERRVERGEVVDPGGDVVERRGPPPAPAGAAELEVPRRPAARHEVVGEVGHQRQGVGVLPPAAVEQDGHRVGSRAGGRRRSPSWRGWGP